MVQAERAADPAALVVHYDLQQPPAESLVAPRWLDASCLWCGLLAVPTIQCAVSCRDGDGR
jgi:hypothetical protein